jgi:ferrochelatase
LLEVAQRYELFGGQSPINTQNRALLTALVGELNVHGLPLPVYWGNRNWHPLLADTVRQMTEDGVRHALAFVTSAFGSYPSCRQYLEDIERARQEVGPAAPAIDKLRLCYNHPGFIEAMAERLSAAMRQVPAERRAAAKLIYTAHSIPAAMAEHSPYERQLREACRLVTERVIEKAEGGKGKGDERRGQGEDEPLAALQDTVAETPRSVPARWQLVFQSRSGPPSQAWLEPDIRDRLRELSAAGAVRDVVIAPIGFLAENIEIIYDLDVEVADLCDELGINMVRAAVVGSHPRFVRMIRELIGERLDPSADRLALGADGPWPDGCPADCCRPEHG